MSTAQPGLLTLSPASVSIQGLQGPRVSGLGCEGWWVGEWDWAGTLGSGAPVIPSVPICARVTIVPGS